MASSRLNLTKVIDQIMMDDDKEDDLNKQKYNTPGFVPIGIQYTPLSNSSSSDTDFSDIDDTIVDPTFKVINNEETDNGISETEDKEPKRHSRKRKRDPLSWKANINRRACQSGKEYSDIKGNIKRARHVTTKKDCKGNCKFQCARNISATEREIIHDHFWKLPDDRKPHFYAQFTERNVKARTRTLSEHSRRKYSLFYFFEVNGVRHRVCKEYFLTTLAVSQRRISYFFDHVRKEHTLIPRSPMKGKHPKRVIPAEMKQSVRDHILSIPRVESHYCRASTQKEYFDSSLNLATLYDMYTEYCNEKSITPVKEHMYRYIFNYEFNFEFLKPKKDRCDKCEEFRNNIKASDEEKEKFEGHQLMKIEAKEERDCDRTNKEKTVICFDLENVISLPRANVSSFFYKRKLSVYNLTAHCSLDKKGYCAIWSEGLSGRTGNDIASALIRILDKVMERHPNIKDIILWSDSCVAQNRNSVMCVALKDFLKRYPSVSSITQKFCEPGHSSIQEVDAVHSLIERTLKKCEIFSPVSLLRLLPSVNRKNPLIVLQMRHEHFFDYQSVSKVYKYSDLPFTKAKQIKFLSTNPSHVSYKKKHTENFLEIRIVDRRPERNTNSNLLSPLPKVKSIPISNVSLLSQDKIKDLSSMFKFMPSVDRLYVKSVCRL